MYVCMYVCMCVCMYVYVYVTHRTLAWYMYMYFTCMCMCMLMRWLLFMYMIVFNLHVNVPEEVADTLRDVGQVCGGKGDLEGVETAEYYQVADTLHQLDKERERQEKSKSELLSESSDGGSSSSQRRSGVFLEQCGYMVTIRNDAQVGFTFFRFVNI